MYYLCSRFSSAGQTLQINLNDETTKRGQDIRMGSSHHDWRERNSCIANIGDNSDDMDCSCYGVAAHDGKD